MASGARIADVFFRALLDDSQLQVDSVKAGDKAGQTLGSRFSNAAKTGLKVFAGIAAGALTAATGAGIELNQTLNDLQAETGATGDDWEHMQSVVRRENGRTTESLDDISAAVKAMRQDLGLTGEQIDKYADKFENAGLATHEGATAMVKDVDDIGDAYGTNLDRSLGVIDQVVASQEKWGGSIHDRLEQLPQLAKAIKGLNGDVDDAQELLNAASASGLDYTEVQKAINSAVAKFAVPRSLQDIIGLQDVHKTKVEQAKDEVLKLEDAIAQFVVPDRLREIVKTLDSIEDPTQRAAAAEKIYNDEVAKFNADPIQRYLDILGQIPDDQARVTRAIELFGPKAGPVWAQLASAVHKAGGDLSSFNISQGQAANKADEVAKHLDEGPIRRLALLREKLTAFLADAGSNPMITSIAAFGTILGGFAPNLSGKIAGGIAKVVAGAWKKVAASALVTGAVQAAADKGATLYLKALFAGDVVSGALSKLWARVLGSTIVGGAIQAAGDKGATLYLKTLLAGDAIGSAVSGAWAATGGKLVAAAEVQGSLAGRVFAAAAAAAIVAAPLAVLYVAIQVADEVRKAKGTFADQITSVIQEGSVEALQNAKKAIEAQIASQKIFGIIPYQFAGEVDAMKRELDRLNAELGKKAAEAALTAGFAGTHAAQMIADAAPKTIATIGAAMTDAAKREPDFKTVGQIIADSLTAGANRILGRDLGKGIKGLARQLPRIFADELQNQRETIDQGWQTFLDALTAVETPTKRAARLLGRLSAKQLAAGLNDSRPEVRLRAQQIYKDTIDELGEIVRDGGKIGKLGMQRLQEAMHSKDKDIRAAARAIYRAIHEPISPAVTNARKWGAAIGNGIKNGLTDAWAGILAIVQKIAGAIADYFKTGSPAKLGPLSLAGGPEGWAGDWIHQMRGAVERAMPGLSAAFGGLQTPSFGSQFTAPAYAVAHSGIAGGTSSPAGVSIGAIHLHGIGSDVSPAAASRFGGMVRDEVAGMFRQQGARVGRHPSRVP